MDDVLALCTWYYGVTQENHAGLMFVLNILLRKVHGVLSDADVVHGLYCNNQLKSFGLDAVTARVLPTYTCLQ